jgi:hypothetical protein
MSQAIYPSCCRLESGLESLSLEIKRFPTLNVKALGKLLTVSFGDFLLFCQLKERLKGNDHLVELI